MGRTHNSNYFPDFSPVEWSAVQQYACNGIMPSKDKVCEWVDLFPKNRLFLTQIRHTLQLLQVEIVIGVEEADAELARHASKTPQAYVVGNDTDFCFFPKARYIPLKTLHADASVVTASVISRRELASCLHLPKESLMTELAILMGNDYVGSSPEDTFDYGGKDAREILSHLRARGEGYRVTSTSGEETERAIKFTRMFYSLQNLDIEFPLPSRAENSLGVEQAVAEEYEGLGMEMPENFPISLSLVQPRDTTLMSGVLRSLKAYTDMAKTDGVDNPIIHPIHLEALQQMSSQRIEGPMPPFWRPQWEDFHACHLIESCIAFIFRRSRASPLVRLSAPSKAFDSFLFHYVLLKMRTPRPTQQPTEQTNHEDFYAKLPPKRASRIIEPRPVLPIDEHGETILNTVGKNRVTIIQGETGCGKSSRVPVMILKAPVPDLALDEVKIFCAQPRRIAAKALVERLRATEPELGKTVALRMGHGVREYENSSTRCWFVTTGYIVRLLSNHPENFDNISHLIIDEIHERSVDTDILCLLCRRLLQSNTKIRLILMSATLAAKLYQDYFDISDSPILKVGARRFPIQEIFLEEIVQLLRLPPKEIKAARQIESECRKTRCIAPPSNSTMDCLYSLAARIAISVGRPGASVLIFVPGMRDIESITEIIEKTYVAGMSYKCIPVHSDIPFEDQMTVFDESDEVKIIIATNAAESSITLPDCKFPASLAARVTFDNIFLESCRSNNQTWYTGDHVICTGLTKVRI